ncbi:MAG: hypothetical protein ABSG98_00035 [Anaerolineales bacterium]
MISNVSKERLAAPVDPKDLNSMTGAEGVTQSLLVQAVKGNISAGREPREATKWGATRRITGSVIVPIREVVVELSQGELWSKDPMELAPGERPPLIVIDLLKRAGDWHIPDDLKSQQGKDQRDKGE